jgi:hypothetical protein
MLQLGRRATRHLLTGAERAALRAHFDEHFWVRLPGVLDPALLSEVQRFVADAEFTEHRHKGVSPPSVDLTMSPGPASALLEMLFNDPAIYRDVEAITGSDPITHFAGFVYRMNPELGHHHHWHNDLIHGRMIAMSVHLGPGTYEGGVTEVRDKASERMLGAVANTTPGDAVIFPLDPSLQHRVTAVTGGVKTAFVGWYCDGRSYFDLLRSAVTP